MERKPIATTVRRTATTIPTDNNNRLRPFRQIEAIIAQRRPMVATMPFHTGRVPHSCAILGHRTVGKFQGKILRSLVIHSVWCNTATSLRPDSGRRLVALILLQCSPQYRADREY